MMSGKPPSPRVFQLSLAAVFFVLGGWCVAAPSSIISLCFRPAFQTQAPLAPFLVGCFGAQALIAGLFATFSRFTAQTFLAYGLGLIPFFVFDAYFYFVQPILSEIGALDTLGNVAMLVLCVLGWRSARAHA